jgi:flavin reductase (DIM6/NTAB) family NADH-FMN oxidoreductase RutF
VNVPSVDLAKEADYCGIVSGVQTDKVATCHFSIFYGKLKNAPLIEQCPLNLECQVVHMLNLGSHMLIIGRIEETYLSSDCLTEGKPDVEKIKPIIYTSSTTQEYRAYGEVVARAFNIGRELK